MWAPPIMKQVSSEIFLRGNCSWTFYLFFYGWFVLSILYKYCWLTTFFATSAIICYIFNCTFFKHKYFLNSTKKSLFHKKNHQMETYSLKIFNFCLLFFMFHQSCKKCRLSLNWQRLCLAHNLCCKYLQRWLKISSAV